MAANDDPETRIEEMVAYLGGLLTSFEERIATVESDLAEAESSADRADQTDQIERKLRTLRDGEDALDSAITNLGEVLDALRY